MFVFNTIIQIFLILVFLFTNINFNFQEQNSFKLNPNLDFEEFDQYEQEELSFQREDIFFYSLKFLKNIKLVGFVFFHLSKTETQFENFKIYFTIPPPSFVKKIN